MKRDITTKIYDEISGSSRGTKPRFFYCKNQTGGGNAAFYCP